MFSHFLRKFAPFAWARPTEAARVVRRAGRYWHLLPEADALLGPDGPDPEAWVADGRAEPVKVGPYRRIYRAALPGGTVYAKHCRVGGLRAWAREVLRPAKARLEFENLLALRRLGIAAIEPLGWGCERPGRPGESVLLTLGRDGAEPFLHFLEVALPALPRAARAAARRGVSRELGRFMARMHDAGVAHPDPHPGNLLVGGMPGGAPRFSLIDVHAVRLGPPLTWAESRANLVLYNRWFQLRASRADRARFWKSYAATRKSPAWRNGGDGKDRARQVEAGTAASNLRFWAGRAKRCVGSNRHFREVRAGTMRGFAVADLPDESLRPFLADPDAVFARPGVRLLKDSRTSTVAELTVRTAEGPTAVVFKRFRVRTWWEPFKNLLRPSAALRSWLAGHALRDRRLPTPRPLALFHRTRFGVPAEGYLLAEKVPDALDLPAAVAHLESLPSAERTALLSAWAARVASLVRTLHDRGGSHRDLKASNVLLEGARLDAAAAVPALIDLVGARTDGLAARAQRVKELARLNASFLCTPAVTHSGRLRFLRQYLRSNVGRRDDWKAWWRAVRCATAAKVAKNARSGRPLH